MRDAPPATVAVLTDFGYHDGYVAIMKGVMLAYAPSIRAVDVTHLVPPQNVLSAASVLYTVLPYFPEGTVFLCVVDPGVGSSRRELIATADGRSIVAPDNGLVSMVARMLPPVACYRAQAAVLAELNEGRPPYSHTFDGRDLFAPLAARIAVHGVDGMIGDAVAPTLLPEVWPELQPVVRSGGTNSPEPTLVGTVVHVDHFGNCVSSIHVSDLGPRYEPADVVLPGTPLRISSLSTTFSDVPRGAVLAYWGSAGFLEIAVNRGNAADTLSINTGDKLQLLLRHRSLNRS